MIAAQERTTNSPKEKLDHRNVVMTIDGSTTAGKRVVAEALAERYNLTVLNTGWTIRAMALLAIEHGLVKTDATNVTDIPVDFSDKILGLYDTMPQKLRIEKPYEGDCVARIMVGNRDMSGELLSYRKEKAIDNLSAIIAASPLIRQKFYGLWRASVKELGGVVVIGRKTGLDLFPDAPVKLYLYASPEASATYRVLHDPTAKLHKSSEARYVRERDSYDVNHGLSDRPSDALAIDTSEFISRSKNHGVKELESRIAQFIDNRYIIK